MSATMTPPLPQALPAPPAAVSPQPLLWSAAAFNDLADRGFFEGRRAFLVDGIILEQGPMNPPHADALEQTDAALRTAFGTGWRFRVQLPLDFGHRTNPMPDFAVLPAGPRGSHPKTAALVVEVADTTLFYDTTTKAELYAATGIPEYWVLDLDARQLLVFRDPAPIPAGGHAYRTRQALGAADSVSPLAVPSAAIRVADLLP